MNKKKELAKNTLIIAFGKICTQLITFFLLPLYTRTLSSSDYGTSDLIITYVSLLAPLLSFQLEYAVFRFLIDCRNNEERKKIYISSSFFSILFLIVLSSVLLLFIGQFINIKYLEFLILIIMVTMLSSLFLQYCRGFGDNKTYSLSSFISGSTNAILNIIFLVLLGTGVVGIFYALIISNLLCSLVIFKKLKLYTYIKPHLVDKNVLRELFTYSLPMIPNSICWWIISVSDKTLISFFMNAEAVGIYSISTKFSAVLTNFFNIFNLSWTESVALHINDNDAKDFLSSIFSSTILLFTSFCAGIIAYLPLCFQILIGNEYLESYKYIPILILGSFFNMIMGMLGSIYIAKKLSKEMAKSTFLAAVLNLIINSLLIRYLGIWASVISTLVSYFFVSLYRIIDIQKYVRLTVKNKDIIKIIFIFTLSITLYYINNSILNIFNAIIISIISLVFNWSLLKVIINDFCKKFKRRKLDYQH